MRITWERNNTRVSSSFVVKQMSESVLQNCHYRHELLWQQCGTARPISLLKLTVLTINKTKS